jgi:hypothetical protein
VLGPRVAIAEAEAWFSILERVIINEGRPMPFTGNYPYILREAFLAKINISPNWPPVRFVNEFFFVSLYKLVYHLKHFGKVFAEFFEFLFLESLDAAFRYRVVDRGCTTLPDGLQDVGWVGQ